MPIMTSDERQPLLDHSSLERGSSTTSTEKAAPTPIPWKPIITLFILNMVTPLTYELIFPFINPMLVELGVVDDPENVGFYSGLIESVFSCMSLITILPCSWASDHFGRKKVILTGIAGVAISTACFGVSRTFPLLILSRCLSGAMGGVCAAIKIMIGELTDRTNQNIAFTGLTLTYRMGQIVGLPIGGLFAHPERHFPGLFGGSFWLAYPFLLPCLIGAGIAVLGITLAIFFLPESTSFKHLSQSKPILDDSCHGVTLVADPSPISVGPEDLVDDAGTPHVYAHTHEDTLTSETSFFQRPGLSRRDSEVTLVSIPAESEKTPTIWELLELKEIRELIVYNLEMTFTSEALFSVYPVFAYTSTSLGGLGFDESQIGIHLSIRACVHIMVLSLFNPVYRRLGRESAVRLHQYSMLLWPVSVLCFPALNFVARLYGTSGWVFNCATAVFFVIWSAAGWCWTSMGMIATDAAPCASALAGVNGLVQLAQTAPLAIVPALATSAFAASIQTSIACGQLVWIFFFMTALYSAIHAIHLREPVDDWRASRTSR